MITGSEEGQPEEVKDPRTEIMNMMRRRTAIDQTILNLGEILKANNIGMTEPLVDPEGYPRNDIDVFQVRHARHQIICLQNDFKGLTKEIEKRMQEYFAAQKEKGESMEMDMEDTSSKADLDLKPIVKVTEVTESSPASSAGLLVNDLILSFGSIDFKNFSTLQDIGTLVQRSVGKAVSVKVKRGNSLIKNLTLIPGPWSGKGLLGCHIVPISIESEVVDR